MSIFIMLALILGCWQPANPSFDHDKGTLIFPDPARRIVVVQAAESGEGLPAARELAADQPLAAAVLKELSLPYHASLIKLNQCARNLAGNDQGPNLLLLSNKEGGFPRTGIRLIAADGSDLSLPELHYVDLVLTEERITAGELDIYSHELGHVMMNNLIGDEFWSSAEGRMSPKQHVSMGVTDVFTAFYEGWGVHFQRLAYDRIPRYRRLFEDTHDFRRSTGLAWHSNLDTGLRIRSVLQNRYIYRRLIPQGVDIGKMTQEDKILLEHVSPLFDTTRLKNAQEMLATEGVIATLFYHMNTDRTLMEGYQGRSFYDRFLLRPLPQDLQPHDLFTPEENIFLKHFYVWHRLAKKKSDLPPFMALLREWGASFPDDREELLKLFITLTRGRSVSDDLAEIDRRMVISGMIGDIQGFRALFPDFQSSFQGLLKTSLEDESRLTANLGPELWVTHPSFKIRSVLWSENPRRPLSININTAGRYELEVFLGAEKAERFLNKRDELGTFESLEQAAEFGFVFISSDGVR